MRNKVVNGDTAKLEKRAEMAELLMNRMAEDMTELANFLRDNEHGVMEPLTGTCHLACEVIKQLETDKATMERKTESQAIGLEQSHRDEGALTARVAELEDRLKSFKLIDSASNKVLDTYGIKVALTHDRVVLLGQSVEVLESKLGQVKAWAKNMCSHLAESSDDLAIEAVEDLDHRILSGTRTALAAEKTWPYVHGFGEGEQLVVTVNVPMTIMDKPVTVVVMGEPNE